MIVNLQLVSIAKNSSRFELGPRIYMHTDSDIPNLMLQGVAKVDKRVAFNRAA
jgi:hypothetical protein